MRSTDTVKECLRKRCLDVTQARRMVHDRSEWRGFVRGECMGHHPADEPLTLMKCHNCEFSQPYEALEGWKSFRSFTITDLLLSLTSWHDACQPCSVGKG